MTAADPRERIDDLMLLNRKLPPLVRGRSERRDPGDRHARKRVVLHAGQAEPRGPWLSQAERQLMVDARAVRIAQLVDGRCAEDARVADVEVALVPQGRRQRVGGALGKDAWELGVVAGGEIPAVQPIPDAERLVDLHGGVVARQALYVVA